MSGHRYRHYGLTLETNRSLPGVTASGSQPADIAIEVLQPGEVAGSSLDWTMPDPGLAIWRAPATEGTWLRLRYALSDDWVEFVIDELGTSVSVARSATVRLQEAAELLLGPVFSCVLRQRGLTCVHSAVVKIDRTLVALVGDSGAGKSTTALALVQEGGLLVSDDVAVLTEVDGRVTVAPGAPRLRMRADAARWLTGSVQSLQPTWMAERPVAPKRYVSVTAAAGIDDDELGGLDILYFLAPWDEAVTRVAVRPLAAIHALPKLMACRHMVQVSDRTADRRDFEVLARLTETARSRTLLRPADVTAARETAAAIICDVRGSG